MRQITMADLKESDSLHEFHWGDGTGSDVREDILEFLGSVDEPQTRRDLEIELHYSREQMERHLPILRDEGLITMRRDSQDARKFVYDIAGGGGRGE